MLARDVDGAGKVLGYFAFPTACQALERSANRLLPFCYPTALNEQG